MKPYIAYVDGSCPNNGTSKAHAGWGVFLTTPEGDTIELAGPVPCDQRQSNGRAELLAPVMAIQACKPGVPITIYSDSKFVVDGAMEWLPGWIKRGWKKSDKKPVEHQDLWKVIHELMQERDITFIWLRGHSGIEGNERADALAALGASGKTVSSKSTIDTLP